MKYTNDQLKSMGFTENFIKMIENKQRGSGHGKEKRKGKADAGAFGSGVSAKV